MDVPLTVLVILHVIQQVFQVVVRQHELGVGRYGITVCALGTGHVLALVQQQVAQVRSTHTDTRHNAQVHDTQHTDERAGSSGEQGASEGAGQAEGNGQARHEVGQAISKNNLTTEERSPGTMRTNQHGLNDDATQSKRTAVT